jgi:2'-5' RNA ligase
MVTVLDASGQMRDHWWWRPGWRVGRSMYTWHATFDGQDTLHAAVDRYQAVLAPLSGIDLIPRKWLHLTMQGVGFTDEVDADDLAKITEAARRQLATHRPVTFETGVPIVDPEAILFAVTAVDELRGVRDGVRAAIAEIWGSEHVPDGPDWTPHVSIAYSNTDGSAAPYVNALASIPPKPAAVTLRDVHLIRLDRDTRVYKWETVDSVPLGG